MLLRLYLWSVFLSKIMRITISSSCNNKYSILLCYLIWYSWQFRVHDNVVVFPQIKLLLFRKHYNTTYKSTACAFTSIAGVKVIYPTLLLQNDYDSKTEESTNLQFSTFFIYSTYSLYTQPYLVEYIKPNRLYIVVLYIYTYTYTVFIHIPFIHL